MPASCLYEGWIRHRRHTPIEHEFRYRIFMAYLDLGELPEALDASPLWSARRPAPAWFRRADYLGDPDVPLADAARDEVGAQTGERPSGPVRVLTHLRYFGHVFNPVSFYYCYDARGEHVDAVLAEVTNTPWGERHRYVLRPTEGTPDAGEPLRARFPKAFHVSPFMGLDLDYEWRIVEPGERLLVHIENTGERGRVFDATLSMRRRELSGAALNRALVRYPAMTLKVVGGIYFEALRLRLKGARWHDHPPGGHRAEPAAPAQREAEPAAPVQREPDAVA